MTGAWLIWNYELEEWEPIEDHFTDEEIEETLFAARMVLDAGRGETHTDTRFGYLLKHVKRGSSES